MQQVATWLPKVQGSSLWSTQKTRVLEGEPGEASRLSPSQNQIQEKCRFLEQILKLRVASNDKQLNDVLYVFYNYFSGRDKSQPLRRTTGERASSLDTDGVWLRLDESRVS